MKGLLFNVAMAVIFGAVSVALPEFTGFLPMLATQLLQVASLLISAGFIGYSVSRSSRGFGFDGLVAGFSLAMTGFLLMSFAGSYSVEYTDNVDYQFTSNFTDDGELSGMLVESDGYLQIDEAPDSGTFTSDEIGGENVTNIDFEEISTRMEDYDSKDDTVDLRLRTYTDGDLVDEYTYTVNQSGIESHDVDEVNREQIDIDSFRWDVEMDTEGNDSPRLDYVTFETSQVLDEPAENNEFVGYLALVVFVLGGIMVVFS